MSEPINPVPTQPNPDPATAHVGGAEGAPVAVSEVRGPSVEIQPPPHEADPNIPAEVRQHIQVNRDPMPDQVAQDAGARPSIPPVDGKGYGMPAWQTVQDARKARDETPADKSWAWLATEKIKQFSKSLLFGNQPKPSEGQ
jgi:hypothetical protein